MCLLKAVCFAFDFVGKWRPTIKKKGYDNFNGTQKCYGQAYFCSKKLFFYADSSVYKKKKEVETLFNLPTGSKAHEDTKHIIYNGVYDSVVV